MTVKSDIKTFNVAKINVLAKTVAALSEANDDFNVTTNNGIFYTKVNVNTASSVSVPDRNSSNLVFRTIDGVSVTITKKLVINTNTGVTTETFFLDTVKKARASKDTVNVVLITTKVKDVNIITDIRATVIANINSNITVTAIRDGGHDIVSATKIVGVGLEVYNVSKNYYVSTVRFDILQANGSSVGRQKNYQKIIRTKKEEFAPIKTL